MTASRTFARIGAAALIALITANACKKNDPVPEPPADLSGWIIYTTSDGESLSYNASATVNPYIDEYSAYVGPNGERYLHVSDIPEDFQGGFFRFESLKTIDLTHLDLSHCTSLKHLFKDCGVKKVDMTGLDLKNVTNMSYMFENCANLKEVKLKGIDATSAETMEGMFNECASLEEVDFTGVKNSRCSNILYMFFNCKSLKSFNLAQVGECPKESSNFMFYGCTSLETIDLSGISWKQLDRSDDYKITKTIGTTKPSVVRIPAILTNQIMAEALKGVESDGTLYYPKGTDPKYAIENIQYGGRKWVAKEY